MTEDVDPLELVLTVLELLGWKRDELMEMRLEDVINLLELENQFTREAR